MDVLTDFLITSIEIYKQRRNLSGGDTYLLFRNHGVFDVLEKHKDIEMLLDDADLVADIDSIISRNGGIRFETVPRVQPNP